MRANPITTSIFRRYYKKLIGAVGIIIFLLFSDFNAVFAQSNINSFTTPDSIKLEIEKQLNNPETINKFNFPKTVKRFYELTFLEANWLRPEQDIKPTVSAMLLLDCVRQYGLQAKNYHPQTLNYELMHNVLSTSKPIYGVQKIEFELLLTDAIISMINDLHYGAFNPKINKSALDDGNPNGIKAEQFLFKIKDSHNLMDSIVTVQPNIDQYKQLQSYMKLIAGHYTCDSYETPEAEVQAICLNMERLRWMNMISENYIQVNIPSYKLYYNTPDSIYQFKIVVGKVLTPTPTLSSSISYLETAPDWKIPSKIFIKELLPKAEKNHTYFENNHMAVYDQKEKFIAINNKSLAQIKQNPKLFHARQTAGCDNALGKVVFRFNNSYDIYLHDTPEQQYFSRSKRAFSHGCVRVEGAENLANLLLKNDGQLNQLKALKAAMSSYTKQRFPIKKQIQIVITYLTTTVENGLLVHFEDVYKLDGLLNKQMFAQTEQLNKLSIKK